MDFDYFRDKHETIRGKKAMYPLTSCELSQLHLVKMGATCCQETL